MSHIHQIVIRNFLFVLFLLPGLFFGLNSNAVTFSQNGATIPALTQITDSGSHIWTVVGGVAKINNNPAGYTSGVNLLLYFNGVIYQQNFAKSWWSWNGTTWVAHGATDPRTVSANGANLPTQSYLVDAAHNVWLLAGGVVYENGALAGFTSNVVQLLLENSIVYQQNNMNMWYSWNTIAWASVTDDPRINLSWASINARNVACLPFGVQTPKSNETSTHKVYAHYMMSSCCFPLSIGDTSFSNPNDYYTSGYINPLGETGSPHLFSGGYLRSRPVPTATSATTAYVQNNYESEVRLALAIGIDGFSVDIQSVGQVIPPAGQTSEMQSMLAAVKAVNADPTIAGGAHFTILPVIDASAMSKDANFTADVVSILNFMRTDPNIARLPNGNLVVSSFDAPVFSTTVWSSILSQINTAEGGKYPAFIPIFLSYGTYAGDDTTGAWDAISYMISSWSARTPNGAAGMAAENAVLHAKKGHGGAVLGNMMPATPQNFRPKDLYYDESENSAEYRASWKSAIGSATVEGADWVQLVTWNDYSENTQVSPSFGSQYGFYDMSAYYISLFKKFNTYIGSDSVTLFYKNQISGTGAPKFNPKTQTSNITLSETDTGAPTDLVEAVVYTDSNDFKTGYDPHVVITVGGKSTSFNIPYAGQTTFTVPITMPATGNAGVSASIVVNGVATVLNSSPIPINSSIYVQNFLYQAATSTQNAGSVNCGFLDQTVYQNVINGVYATAAAK